MTYFFKAISFKKALCVSALSASLLGLAASSSYAQSSSEDDVVVVTGSIRASGGGAQDIKHFRGEVESGEIPDPEGMTSEGLLNEHDLFLTSGETCAQTLCLNSAAKSAYFVEGDYFAGLGFDTNIDKNWERGPLNLVAVIDRSGSMGGQSIRNVKHSLREITGQLQTGDQISFVLYGSDVVTHLEPLRITAGAKDTIFEKIRSIKIEGSTNMDAGLARAYDIAYETKAEFDGTTRVMIFTDERPNTGRTDADGFMSRARRASQDGIGMTTIGYGVDYGGELAAKIASVRGGNLFYVGKKDHVKNLFDKEFDLMVSEIAHDLTVAITPAPGLEIAEVFGVPSHMISEGARGATVLTVPTVFLSSNGGGLFVSMKGEPVSSDPTLFNAELKYNERAGQRASEIKAELSAKPAETLRKAEALSAQYKAMKAATEAYHARNYEAAYEIFSPFAEKFTAEDIDGLKEEVKLVSALNESFAIEAGRVEELETLPKYVQLQGVWEVTRAENMLDLSRGDRFDFSDEYVEHFRRKLGFDKYYTDEEYRVNDSQIYLTESDLTFRYSFSKKGHLRLQHRDQETAIYLRPYVKQESASSSDTNLQP